MEDDTALEEHLEWLRSLFLPEDEFRDKAREYFDSTIEMDRYMESFSTPRTVAEPGTVEVVRVFDGYPSKELPRIKGRHRKR